MKILIVEDDIHSSEFIKQLLQDFYPAYAVVGVADSVRRALELFVDEGPDLLIMDINLGDQNSFDLFEYIDTSNKAIIFISSYQEFAIRAIKVDAVDYLVKPINITDFKLAIERVKDRLELIKAKKKSIKAKRKEVFGKFTSNKKMLIFDNFQITPVNIDSIVKLRSDGSYSHIYLEDGHVITNSRRLGLLEKMLKDFVFLRIHDSCLINPRYILSYTPGDRAYVSLADGSNEFVSKSKKKQFLEFYKG